MGTTTKLNIGKIPISKGEYQEGTTYQRLNQVTMLGSTYQSKIDDNTSAPAQIGADGAVENINTDKWLCIAVGNVSSAKKVVYNNENSGLEAGNVQEAIDEVGSKLSDLSTNKLNKIYFDNEHKMPFILEAFTKNTDNSYSVEYVSYNNESYGNSCWLRDKNDAQIILFCSEIYNKKLFFISNDYSIFIVIDVELIQEDKQSGAFYQIALNSNIYNVLNSPFINDFINNKELKDITEEYHVTKKTFEDLVVTKGYLSNDGKFQKNDAFFCSDFIELKGTRALLKNVGNNDYNNSVYKVIHFYNSNKENIENLFSNEIKGSVNNLTYTNEAKYVRFFTNFEITTDLMSIEFDNINIVDGKILDINDKLDNIIDIKNILIDWKDGVEENKDILFGNYGKTSDILKIDRKLDIYVTNPCKQTTPEAYVPYFNRLIFFDENKTTLFKETKYNGKVLNREKIEIPSNARYIQFCFGEEDFDNVHIYVRLRDLIKYNAFKAINVYNRDREKRIDYDNISTPKYIDCCIGLPLSYFTDNLSNRKGYIDSATASNGMSSYKNNGGIYFRGRKLISYTAIEEKEETVTLHQIDTSNSKLSDEPPYAMNTIQKVITLRSIDRNNGSGHKNIMILGDSLIDQNISVQYIKELFDQDSDVSVSFIGTRGTTPALHEGHSGWSCVDFISNNSPFYIDGVLSVKKYFDKNKEAHFNTSDTIDYVIIALGTNDIRQGVRMFKEDECLAIGNDMKKIVDLFLKDYPNAKIAVNLPSTSGLYSAYGYYSFFRMSMIRLRNVYISLFDNGVYNKNVTCVDSGSQISKEYGYDYESLPIDDIITDEILSGFKGGGGETNIHPNSKGYKQIGKAYYCKIRSWIAGNL